MPYCSRCGSRLSHNDETSKLTEYVCPSCHRTTVEYKDSYRVTP